MTIGTRPHSGGNISVKGTNSMRSEMKGFASNTGNISILLITTGHTTCRKDTKELDPENES